VLSAGAIKERCADASTEKSSVAKKKTKPVLHMDWDLL
jgi:hypothetical protein